MQAAVYSLRYDGYIQYGVTKIPAVTNTFNISTPPRKTICENVTLQESYFKVLPFFFNLALFIQKTDFADIAQFLYYKSSH